MLEMMRRVISRYHLPLSSMSFMKALKFFFVVTLLISQAVHAQDYTPLPGQPGKDVVWIPTPDHVATSMLDLAKVTASDYVIDLGSGDGRLVIEAAKRGARAHGVEFNADLVTLSRRNAAIAGVADKATFAQGDMFEADISKATAMPIFLLPAHLERLAPKFLQLIPGARIISNTYEIGGGWEPDESIHAKPCLSWCVAHLYIIPVNAAGVWQLEDGSQLNFEQSYQQVYGSYQIDNIGVLVNDGRVRGYDIGFTINNTRYTARIKGDTMTGTIEGRIEGSVRRNFTAQRLQK